MRKWLLRTKHSWRLLERGHSEKIAYLIMAHQDPENLKHLVQSLDYNADFYIHVDEKVDIQQFEVMLQNRKNVFFSRKRISVCWGGFSQALPALFLIEQASENGTYARYTFITGADCPVYSARQVYENLVQDLNTEYICAIDLVKLNDRRYLEKVNRSWKFDYPNQTKHLHYKRGITNKLLGIVSHKEIRYKPYYGFAYWSITEQCALYVLEQYKKGAYIKQLKNSYAPIELLIHTIIFNSEFRSHAIELDNLDRGDIMAYAPLHYVKYSENGSKILDENDYDALIESKKMFFQKSNSKYSSKLWELMNESSVVM